MKKLLVLAVCLLPLAAQAQFRGAKHDKHRKVGTTRDNTMRGSTLSSNGEIHLERKVTTHTQFRGVQGRIPGVGALQGGKATLLEPFVKGAARRNWEIEHRLGVPGGLSPVAKREINIATETALNRPVDGPVLDAMRNLSGLTEMDMPLLEQQFWKFILSDLISGENEFATEKTPGKREAGEDFSVVLQRDVCVITWDPLQKESSRVRFLKKGTELKWDHSLKTGEANYSDPFNGTHVESENRDIKYEMEIFPKQFKQWRARMLRSSLLKQVDLVPSRKHAAQLLFSPEGKEFFGQPMWGNPLSKSSYAEIDPHIYVPVIKPFTLLEGQYARKYEPGSFARVEVSFSEKKGVQMNAYFAPAQHSEVSGLDLPYIAKILKGGDKTEVIDRDAWFERFLGEAGTEIFVPKQNMLIHEDFTSPFVLTPKNKLIMKEGLLVEITGPKPTREKFLQDQIPAEFVNKKSTARSSEDFVGETRVETMSNWWLGLNEKQRQEVIARAQAEAAENGWQQPTTVKDFYWSNEAYKANKAKQPQVQQPTVVDAKEELPSKNVAETAEPSAQLTDPAEDAFVEEYEQMPDIQKAQMQAEVWALAAALGEKAPDDVRGVYRLLKRKSTVHERNRRDFEESLTPTERAFYGVNSPSHISEGNGFATLENARNAGRARKNRDNNERRGNNNKFKPKERYREVAAKEQHFVTVPELNKLLGDNGISPESIGSMQSYKYKYAQGVRRNYIYQMVQVQKSITLNGKEVSAGSYLDVTDGKLVIRTEQNVKTMFIRQ